MYARGGSFGVKRSTIHCNPHRHKHEDKRLRFVLQYEGDTKGEKTGNT